MTPLPPMPQSPPGLHRPPSPLFPPLKPLLIPLVPLPPTKLQGQGSIPYPQKITIPPTCHHNHTPPRPVLSTPTLIPHHITRSPTLVGCCSSGTVIAICPLLASRRTIAHHPQLAVAAVHHTSLITAKATQASPSPSPSRTFGYIFGEGACAQRGAINKIGQWGGPISSCGKKKGKYHDDFYMKPRPRQKLGHALACARVIPPMPLYCVICHTGITTW